MRQKYLIILQQFLAIVVILSTLLSCSPNSEDTILGKWSEIGGTEKIELFKDGTITIINKDSNMSGKFTFIDKGRIEIELKGLAAFIGPIVVTVSISSSEMTWSMPDGTIFKYRKEK